MEQHVLYNETRYTVTNWTRTKGVLAMKKVYVAPLVEYLAFSVEEAIAEDPNSFPYNDGELGWT